MYIISAGWHLFLRGCIADIRPATSLLVDTTLLVSDHMFECANTLDRLGKPFRQREPGLYVMTANGLNFPVRGNKVVGGQLVAFKLSK